MRSSRLVIVERGFDGVTVSEIARAAELSEMTVFNYFPTKEDLVFGRMEFFEEQLVAAVQQRAPESRRWPPSVGWCSRTSINLPPARK
jgi:AcrR family transcriptional regulator